MDLLMVMILLFGLCIGFAAGMKRSKLSEGILLSVLPMFIGGLAGIGAYCLAFLFGLLLGDSSAC